MDVEVRAFAAARATLGWSRRTLPIADGAAVSDLIAALGAQAPGAIPVLERCAVLLDGTRVHAPETVTVRHGALIDLLPPFAGG